MASGIVLAVLLAGLTVAYWYYYSHPVQNDALNNRVLRRLERISGLPVSYDSASLTLSNGQYRITNLRFANPDGKSEPVLTIEEVDARVRPWEILFNPEAVITSVVIKRPSPLDLIYTHNSLRLGPRAQFLVNSVQKSQPPGTSKRGKLPIESLEIQDLDLVFTEKEGILPDLSPAKPVMVLSGDLSSRNANADALTLDFVGQANRPGAVDPVETSGTMASGVKATLQLLEGGKIALKTKADRLALDDMFRENRQASLYAQNVALDVTTSLAETTRTITGTLNSGSFKFSNPERKLTIEDSNVSLAADLDLDTSHSTLAVRSLDLKSIGAEASASGEVNYAGKPAYAGTLNATRLNDTYRDLLMAALPQGWEIQSGDTGIGGKVEVAGHGSQIERLRGQVNLRTVHVLAPGLPAALQNLRGDVFVTEKSLLVKDMSAE